MNTKSLWIASLSGAALTTLVSNLPYIGLVNCLLCAGFWGSAIFAVWLYQRLSGAPTTRHAAGIGALTGLLAGLLGFLLSFAGFAGAQGFLNTYGKLMGPDALKGMDTIPAWGGIVFNLIGVLFNLGFGTLGGLIGGALLNRTRQPAK
jgi:hypothetical protein